MAKEKPKLEAAQPPSDAKRGRLAGLRSVFGWRRLRWSKRTAIVLAVAFVLIAGHIIALVVWLPQFLQSKVQRPVTLQMALAALDRHSLAEAKYLATALQQFTLESRERGGPPFVLGAVAAAEAEFGSEADRNAAYQSAARYLEEARIRGFPEGRQAQGLFLLGKYSCLTGNYAVGRIVLEDALRANYQPSGDVYGLLAVAYFRGSAGDISKAREYSDRYLAEPSLSQEDRHRALLLHARILDRLNERSATRAALDQIPATSTSYGAALEFEAELLIREARATLSHSDSDAALRAAAKSKYQQAIEKLEDVQRRGDVTHTLALRAMYSTGIGLLESDNLPAAQAQFERILKQSPQSNEGVAAAFQNAEVLRRQGREAEALGMYRRVVQAIGNPAAYQNEFLSLDTLRNRLLATYELDLRAARFEQANELSQLLHPLFPRERELELSGELLRSAARSYLAKIDTASAEQAKILEVKARRNLRQAGQAFAKLAELHVTSRAYADDLWNAAECMMQGHDYRHATQALELYLRNELRRRRASALLLLGEARLTLGETDKAATALQECTEAYPSDPASYSARLLLVKIYLEKGEAIKAEKLLRENLEDGNLTPRSAEWRESLFALGKLLHGDGRHLDGIRRLEEAVARYPSAPQAIEARYLIAESYRGLTRQAQEKLAKETIESARIARTKQIQQNLNDAVNQYEQVQAILARREQQHDSSPLDKAILRNCYFALGMSLYDLGRYDDAVRVYSTATNLYRNEPEVLEAFMQIAACYRRLNRPQEARGTIAQAKAAWERLPKDAPFALTTNFSREEWGQMLDGMAVL